MQPLPYPLVHAVLESAPDAMLMVDAGGFIRFANQQVSSLFGHPHEELLGMPVEQLMPKRFRSAHVVHRDEFARSNRRRAIDSGLGLRGLRADGTEFPVEISLNPVRCEPEPFFIAAIRDITSHLKLERELREARAEAERANLAKSRFLATASHDLRQPLHSIALLVGALHRLPSSGPEALGLIHSLNASVETVRQLLNALLDISKLESGRFQPETRNFRVGPLLQELQAEFSAAAHEKGLEIVIASTDDTARSDPILVGQILRNLIANAIKYTTKGRVTLRSRRETDGVRIDVSDSGIGMAPDHLAYIFDEFYQIGIDPNSSREGYGLGLAIVQRLVKLLGLRIEVASQVGVGSTFTLSVPCGVSAAISEPVEPRGFRAPEGRQRHVLLIEDDAGVRQATEMLLKTEGYRVTPAASLDEALKRAEESRDIEVIVSDFHLCDGANGADAISAVRATLGNGTKAILVTGDTTLAAHDQRLKVDGPLRFAQKPLNAERLLEMLDELIDLE